MCSAIGAVSDNHAVIYGRHLYWNTVFAPARRREDASGKQKAHLVETSRARDRYHAGCYSDVGANRLRDPTGYPRDTYAASRFVCSVLTVRARPVSICLFPLRHAMLCFGYTHCCCPAVRVSGGFSQDGYIRKGEICH